MIPTNETTLNESISFTTLPSLNYKMDMVEHIRGKTDELEAMKQVCYKILMTERYQYLIYSWNYGIELEDLFGEPMTYVIPIVQKRIIDALTADDRVESVTDFKFNTDKRHDLAVEFTVHTIFGDFDMEKNLNV